MTDDQTDDQPLGFVFRRSLLCLTCAQQRRWRTIQNEGDSLVRPITRAALHPDVRLVCERCKAWIGGDEEERETAYEERVLEPDGSEDAIILRIGDTIADAKERLFLATLDHHGGHRARTAKTLGVSARTIHQWLGCRRSS